MIKPIEVGHVGHFICGQRCQFRRHTIVGNHVISTVGELFIDFKDIEKDKMESLSGIDSELYYETMVFKAEEGSRKLKCGCFETLDWAGLEMRRYYTAEQAQAGHEELVEKYIKLEETL